MKLFWWKVLLLIYTFGRILGGIYNAETHIQYWIDILHHSGYIRVMDESDPGWRFWNRYNWLIFMIQVPLPIITGLGVFCFLARSNRFSAQSPVHLWSRRQVLLCAVFLYDFWLFDWNDLSLYPVRDFTLDILILLQMFIQTCMINVKLKALGWQRIPKCCIVLCSLASLYASFGSVTQFIQFRGDMFDCSQYDIEPSARGVSLEKVSFYFLPRFGCSVPTWHMLVFLPVVLLQALSLWYSAWRFCTWEHRWTVCCLLLNGFLALLGTGTSIWCSAVSYPYKEGSSSASSLQAVFSVFLMSDLSDDKFSRVLGILSRTNQFWTIVDLSIQVFNSLLLSGMIGPRQWANQLETFRQLAEASGFNLGQNKRIAFPGKINESSMRCLVLALVFRFERLNILFCLASRRASYDCMIVCSCVF